MSLRPAPGSIRDTDPYLPVHWAGEPPIETARDIAPRPRPGTLIAGDLAAPCRLCGRPTRRARRVHYTDDAGDCGPVVGWHADPADQQAVPA